MNTLLATPLLLLLAPADTALTLAPAVGTTLSKQFSSHSHLEGGDLTVIMGGQEVPSEYLPDMEFVFDNRREVSFTDAYLRSADGRVLELVRTFDDLSDVDETEQVTYGQGLDNDVETTATGDSALEGSRVRFTWDGEEETYDATFADEGEHDRQLLEGLVAGADLAGFLPDEAVTLGDEWTVPGEAFLELFLPGGDLTFVYEGNGADQQNQEELEASVKGELTVTFRGERSVGGATVALLQVEGELTTKNSRETDLDDIPVVDGYGTATLRQVLTIEGEILWNLDTGLPHSAEFTATIEAEATIEADVESAGQDFSSTIKLSGEATFTAFFEPAD